ncbi:VacJ family lipoprotein [Candidatus Puniceispirillum sp.]|nr:VacJ family lipoprotein [Candidatus Puniceispirillum sp.]
MNMFASLHIFKPIQIIGLLLVLIFLSACSTAKEMDRTDLRDPYEISNRKVFALNTALDTKVIEPAANMYRQSIPDVGRHAVNNHIDWAGLPATTFNSLMQGRFENAGLSVLHFVVNGLTLGLADLTEDPKAVNSQDFGQTLAYFDVPEGSFLMVPILGPNTSRSLTGRIVDNVTNPMLFLKSGASVQAIQSMRAPATVVSFRSNMFEVLNDIKYNSLDPYARTRSFYYQSRAGRINAVIGKPTTNQKNDDQFESFLEGQ